LWRVLRGVTELPQCFMLCDVIGHSYRIECICDRHCCMFGDDYHIQYSVTGQQGDLLASFSLLVFYLLLVRDYLDIMYLGYAQLPHFRLILYHWNWPLPKAHFMTWSRNLLECAESRCISEQSAQKQQHRSVYHSSRSFVVKFALLGVIHFASIKSQLLLDFIFIIRMTPNLCASSILSLMTVLVAA
jgi:hypothetical protein